MPIVKSDIRVHENFESEFFQSITVDYNFYKFLLVSVYRPHRISFQLFRDTLIEFIDRRNPSLVTGDFNLDITSIHFSELEQDMKERERERLRLS